MSDRELFVLDAVLKDVIQDCTFTAVLPNGHQVVAFPPPGQRDAWRGRLRPGGSVRLEMSPFDMSRGTFVMEQEVED